MEQSKNIPAFPLAFQEQDASGMPRTEMYAHDGMTLRDFFAANAMQGLLVSWGGYDVGDFREIAEDAYSAADAMISEREK